MRHHRNGAECAVHVAAGAAYVKVGYVMMKIAVWRKVRFARALRSRPFAFLWTGQLISALGDSVYTIGIAWLVLTLTGSATAMGIVVVANVAPILVVPLLGGTIADRAPRQLVMLWSDSTRAAVALIVATLAWLNVLHLWQVFVLAFVFGVCESLFYPAYQAIRPQLVSRDALLSANALTGLSRQVSRLAGPLLGAGVVSLVGPPAALAFDGLTFIFSAVCLLAIRISDDQPTQIEVGLEGDESKLTQRKTLGRALSTLVQDVREGIHYIVRSTWLWTSIVLAALINVGLFAPLLVTLPKLVRDEYHAGAWLFGMMISASAVGSITALLLVGQAIRLHGRGVLAYGALMACSCALIVLGAPLPQAIIVVTACAAEVVLGFGLAVFGTIWETVLQELVVPEQLARVSSVDLVISSSLLPLGYVIAGAMTDRLTGAFVFVVAGIFTLSLAALALSVPAIRHLD